MAKESYATITAPDQSPAPQTRMVEIATCHCDTQYISPQSDRPPRDPYGTPPTDNGGKWICHPAALGVASIWNVVNRASITALKAIGSFRRRVVGMRRMEHRAVEIAFYCARRPHRIAARFASMYYGFNPSREAVCKSPRYQIRGRLFFGYCLSR